MNRKMTDLALARKMRRFRRERIGRAALGVGIACQQPRQCQRTESAAGFEEEFTPGTSERQVARRIHARQYKRCVRGVTSSFPFTRFTAANRQP